MNDDPARLLLSGARWLRQNPPSSRTDPVRRGPPQGDPWHAFGYLVSGVLAVRRRSAGWLDRWLGHRFLVAIGILVGAGFGIYMTFARFDSVRRATVQPHDDSRRRGELDGT